MPDNIAADPIPHEKRPAPEPLPSEQTMRPLADEKGFQPVEMNEPVVERRSFNLPGLIGGAVVVVLVVLGVVWLVSGSGQPPAA